MRKSSPDSLFNPAFCNYDIYMAIVMQYGNLEYLLCMILKIVVTYGRNTRNLTTVGNHG